MLSNMSTKNSSIPPPLVRFYDPTSKGKDYRGRTLSQILSWSDEKLEASHDYIQYLFPLPEHSPYNYSAPIVNREVFNAFRSRPEIRAQLRKALARMLKFYGFKFNHPEGCHEEIIVADPPIHNQKWVRKFDHNHLRITRILRSLRILGLEKEADMFFKMLYWMTESLKCEGPKACVISDTSLEFWSRAIDRPLYLAPDDVEDEGLGADFLYEFEKNTSSRIPKKRTGCPYRHVEGECLRLGNLDGPVKINGDTDADGNIIHEARIFDPATIGDPSTSSEDLNSSPDGAVPLCEKHNRPATTDCPATEEQGVAEKAEENTAA